MKEATMTTIELITTCWHCGTANECVTNSDIEADQQAPVNGDATFCFQCGVFAIFDDTLSDKVRKPSPAENDVIKRTPELQQVYQAWKLVKNAQ